MARPLNHSKPHESPCNQIRWWRITAKDLTHEDLHVSEPQQVDEAHLRYLERVWITVRQF